MKRDEAILKEGGLDFSHREEISSLRSARTLQKCEFIYTKLWAVVFG